MKRKKNREVRPIFSTRLLPRIVKALKSQAAYEGRFVYEIIEDSLRIYFAGKGAERRKAILRELR
jgi:hypothetical protein